jgi:sugar transferase (PEP-CTERM/EpsH1 system associated)
MLTHRVPYPPDRGDRIRAYHLLEAIATRYDVTLATVADEPIAPATMDRLDSLCSRVLVAHARPMQRRTAAARALFTGQAITPAAMYDRGLARQLIQLHDREPFDSVLTYCTGMVGYTQALYNASTQHQQPPSQDGGSSARNPHLAAGAKGGFRHVLDLVDVDSQKWAGFAKTTRGPMRLVYQAESRRLRAVEAGGVVPFDAVTVISDAEAQRYRQHVTDRHEPVVVGNGVDLRRFMPGPPTREPVITFTGVMSYKPNIDAAAWFSRQVMPRILAAVPGARFDIVGKSPAREVLGLDELPGVRVVGPVESTAESLRASAVAVAPMRIAPGVQNKVLEAMACGLPVVCSTPAASGIDAAPGENLLVRDDAADVAAQCVGLLLNPDERARLGSAARYRVQQRYDWAAATAPMLELLVPQTTSLIP